MTGPWPPTCRTLSFRIPARPYIIPKKPFSVRTIPAKMFQPLCSVWPIWYSSGTCGTDELMLRTLLRWRVAPPHPRRVIAFRIGFAMVDWLGRSAVVERLARVTDDGGVAVIAAE